MVVIFGGVVVEIFLAAANRGGVVVDLGGVFVDFGGVFANLGGVVGYIFKGVL